MKSSLIAISILIGLNNLSYAKSQVKIICDVDGGNIYLDHNLLRQKCKKNISIPIIVNSGKHLIEVKKDNRDVSFYYKKDFKIGDNVSKKIQVKSKLLYSEEYYYSKIKKNKDIELGLKYMQDYPNGKYIDVIKKILGNSWSKTFGGRSIDEADSLIKTKDGGFVFAGYTKSKGAGSEDLWVVKLDINGNIIWDKTFGGTEYDAAESIYQTKDDGFIVAGTTESKGAGGSDAWVIKIDKNGNKVWDRTYGGSSWDEAHSIIQTKDGGYAFCGTTESEIEHFWVVKLDEDGNVIWDKTFKSPSIGACGGNAIIQTKDGGFAVAGMIQKKVFYDARVVKLNKNGHKEWDRSFGGKDRDEAYSIIQTKDGGFAVAGKTELKGKYYDAWVIRLNRYGHKKWNFTFGGKEDDEAYSIIQTKDGGFAVAGRTYVVKDKHSHAFVLKLDRIGHKKSKTIYNISDSGEAKSIVQTEDGGLIVAGDAYLDEERHLDALVLKIKNDLH